MIKYHTERMVESGVYYRKGTCLSGDTKPSTDASMAQGSELMELDTSTRYYFDAENGEWWPWMDGGSGGYDSDDESNPYAT